MELLTQKQVYNEVGATSLSTNELITKFEAQNIASQKLKRVTTDLSSYGNTEIIDEFACEDMTTAEYSIQISYDKETWSDQVQILFAADTYGQNHSKPIYVRALKTLYLLNGTKYSEEEVDYTLSPSSAQHFESSKTTDGYSFWAKTTNDNSSFITEKIKVVNAEDPEKSCELALVQVKNGMQLVYGDVVDFTYYWSQGTDLDQKTTIECYIPGVQDQSVGYSWGSRVSLNGANVLGWGGDNTGTGEEHALVDFDSIAKYVVSNGDDASTISGKTIKEALTDENGFLTCKVYLYTSWFNTAGYDISLSYTAYNKTGDFSFSNNNDSNKTFTINGVTQTARSQAPAYCSTSWKNYTRAAVFTYYFNSGMFSIETNKSA